MHLMSFSSASSSTSPPPLFNGDTRMIDGIEAMRQGCSLIILDSDQINDRTLDFQHYSLSKDNKSIVCHLNPQKSIRISDVAEVSVCKQEAVDSIHQFLNVSGLETLGLQPILFEILFKKRKQQKAASNLIIFDSMANSNIWFHGLKKLIRLKSPFSIKSLSVVVGNELENYCNDEMKDAQTEKKGKKNKKQASRFDFRNAAFVESIRSNLDGISRSLVELHRFGMRNCIFGSESHIGLLAEATECMELLKEIKLLLNINDENCQIFFSSNNYDIHHLKQIWVKLNVKLAIVCLKSLDLRNALQHDLEHEKSDHENENYTCHDTNDTLSHSLSHTRSHSHSDSAHAHDHSHAPNDNNNVSEQEKGSQTKRSSIYDIFESAVEIQSAGN